MSEVEKMYENAGIKKFEPKEEFSLDDCEEYCIDNNCKECSWRKYPPFTAEKQILLIQWLLDKTDLYLHRHKTDFTYSIAYKCKDFKESIAEFINAIWQDLTEEERAEIKNILEM